MALTVRAGSVRAMVLVVLFAVLWTATGAGGPRLIVEIEEPFVLQGQICPAGTISIRPVSQYNPASTLHEVCVERECLGVFPAERIAFETDDERDTLRFERDAGGLLVLVGYTLHRDGRAEFHRFARSPNAPVHLLAKSGVFPFATMGRGWDWLIPTRISAIRSSMPTASRCWRAPAKPESKRS